MKNARHSKAASSATEHGNCNAGSLPKRVNTLQAGVLAAMIEGRSITSMDAVFEQSTTRAAAVVHALQRDYGWHIDRSDIAVGTNDGRVSWVVAYWLGAQAREAAFAAGARAWVEAVNAATEKRRTKAAEVREQAASLNAKRDGA